MPFLQAFYNDIYNNVKVIDGERSKWFVYDQAFKAIQATLGSRQAFVRDYCSSQQMCKLQNLFCDRKLLKQSLSDFGYFCPVTWKNEKLLVKCVNNHETVVLYKTNFFYFRSLAERDQFVKNPQRFLLNVTFPAV